MVVGGEFGLVSDVEGDVHDFPIASILDPFGLTVVPVPDVLLALFGLVIPALLFGVANLPDDSGISAEMEMENPTVDVYIGLNTAVLSSLL